MLKNYPWAAVLLAAAPASLISTSALAAQCSRDIISNTCSFIPTDVGGVVVDTAVALQTILEEGSGNDSLDDAIAEIGTLEEPEQILAVLSTATEESTSFYDAVVKTNAMTQKSVSSRLSSLRTAMAGESFHQYAHHQHQDGQAPLVLFGGGAGDEISRWTLYTMFNYEDGEIDRTANQAGYDYDGYTLSVGVDYLASNEWLAGFSFGLPDYENDFDSPGTKTEIDGYTYTLYTSYFADNWHLDASLSYADLEYDISRLVEYGSQSQQAKANNVGGEQWTIAVGGGYLFFVDAWQFEIEASGVYTDAEVDAYQERSGTSDNWLMLDVDKIDDLKSKQLILGGTASYTFSTESGVVIPYLRGYLHYEFEDGNEIYQTGFVVDQTDTSLPVTTDETDEVYGRVHLGVSSVFAHGWRAYIDGAALVNMDNTDGYSLTFGIHKDI